ncbi:hypothetical protein IW261DRAFT_1425571 [Armillaria novae-zelandiae]|uniref:Uncharacterized protein n=1 Tax=Armillaria novae-zelandiae TaxID=153914 RepID=A0AA39NS74_9AGAR|nr:hypothetical protein IW261DRAFT_1425571 [Armillaria novae-zelandiae]
MKSTFYKGPRNISVFPQQNSVPVACQQRCPSLPPKGKSKSITLTSANKTYTFHITTPSTTIPRDGLYRAPQLCIDPKLVDPGFLYGEREEEEEEEEQGPTSSPTRKRKALTRKKAGIQSPKKKAESNTAKPRASTAVASPQKKGRK